MTLMNKKKKGSHLYFKSSLLFRFVKIIENKGLDLGF
jgi:hypothetical protein